MSDTTLMDDKSRVASRLLDRVTAHAPNEWSLQTPVDQNKGQAEALERLASEEKTLTTLARDGLALVRSGRPVGERGIAVAKAIEAAEQQFRIQLNSTTQRWLTADDHQRHMDLLNGCGDICGRLRLLAQR